MPRIKYFKVEEVAEMFSVNPVTVRRWIHQGLIGAVDIVEGDRSDYRISEADIAKYDEQRRIQAAS